MSFQKSKWVREAKPYVKMWQMLEKKLDNAFVQLKKDIYKNKGLKTIQKDKNEIVLLLGECNYLTRECLHWSRQQKKRKK